MFRVELENLGSLESSFLTLRLEQKVCWRYDVTCIWVWMRVMSKSWTLGTSVSQILDSSQDNIQKSKF
jgi:hypothetical protein